MFLHFFPNCLQQKNHLLAHHKAKMNINSKFQKSTFFFPEDCGGLYNPLEFENLHLLIVFFFIDFCPKIKFRNVHIMEHLGEFHKSTRRGDFVKIFENVHKMEHFRKILLVF